ADLNEAACGGGRYAWARSKIFPSQPDSSSMGSVVTETRLAKCRMGGAGELLSTQKVRLLSPAHPAAASTQHAAPFQSRYRKSSATYPAPAQRVSPQTSDQR